MAIKAYYPEMGQARPQAPIYCRPHMFRNRHCIETALPLSGRGIERDRCGGANDYIVTRKAFAALAEQHDIACELLLD